MYVYKNDFTKIEKLNIHRQPIVRAKFTVIKCSRFVRFKKKIVPLMLSHNGFVHALNLLPFYPELYHINGGNDLH